MAGVKLKKSSCQNQYHKPLPRLSNSGILMISELILGVYERPIRICLLRNQFLAFLCSLKIKWVWHKEGTSACIFRVSFDTLRDHLLNSTNSRSKLFMLLFTGGSLFQSTTT